MKPPEPTAQPQPKGAPAGKSTATRSALRPRIPFIEFEARGEPLLPLDRFWNRLRRGAIFGFGLIGGSLLLGVLGYHVLGRLGWIDSLLNASMILAGMGPVDPLPTDAAKIFASAYAIFSGVMFLTSVGILFAPVAHRFMHRFHLGEDGSA